MLRCRLGWKDDYDIVPLSRVLLPSTLTAPTSLGVLFSLSCAIPLSSVRVHHSLYSIASFSSVTSPSLLLVQWGKNGRRKKQQNRPSPIYRYARGLLRILYVTLPQPRHHRERRAIRSKSPTTSGKLQWRWLLPNFQLSWKISILPTYVQPGRAIFGISNPLLKIYYDILYDVR